MHRRDPIRTQSRPSFLAFPPLRLCASARVPALAWPAQTNSRARFAQGAETPRRGGLKTSGFTVYLFAERLNRPVPWNRPMFNADAIHRYGAVACRLGWVAAHSLASIRLPQGSSSGRCARPMLTLSTASAVPGSIRSRQPIGRFGQANGGKRMLRAKN